MATSSRGGLIRRPSSVSSPKLLSPLSLTPLAIHALRELLPENTDLANIVDEEGKINYSQLADALRKKTTLGGKKQGLGHSLEIKGVFSEHFTLLGLSPGSKKAFDLQGPTDYALICGLGDLFSSDHPAERQKRSYTKAGVCFALASLAPNITHEQRANAYEKLSGIWEKLNRPANANLYSNAKRYYEQMSEYAAEKSSFALVQRIHRLNEIAASIADILELQQDESFIKNVDEITVELKATDVPENRIITGVLESKDLVLQTPLLDRFINHYAQCVVDERPIVNRTGEDSNFPEPINVSSYPSSQVILFQLLSQRAPSSYPIIEPRVLRYSDMHVKMQQQLSGEYKELTYSLLSEGKTDDEKKSSATCHAVYGLFLADQAKKILEEKKEEEKGEKKVSPRIRALPILQSSIQYHTQALKTLQSITKILPPQDKEEEKKDKIPQPRPEVKAAISKQESKLVELYLQSAYLLLEEIKIMMEQGLLKEAHAYSLRAMELLRSTRFPGRPVSNAVKEAEARWSVVVNALVEKAKKDNAFIKEDYDKIVQVIGNFASLLPNDPRVSLYLTCLKETDYPRYWEEIVSKALNPFKISTSESDEKYTKEEVESVFKSLRLSIAGELEKREGTTSKSASAWRVLATNPTAAKSYIKLAGFYRGVIEEKTDTPEQKDDRNWLAASLAYQWVTDVLPNVHPADKLSAQLYLAQMNAKTGHGITPNKNESCSADQYAFFVILQNTNPSLRISGFSALEQCYTNEKLYEVSKYNDIRLKWKSLIEKIDIAPQINDADIKGDIDVLIGCYTSLGNKAAVKNLQAAYSELTRRMRAIQSSPEDLRARRREKQMAALENWHAHSEQRRQSSAPPIPASTASVLAGNQPPGATISTLSPTARPYFPEAISTSPPTPRSCFTPNVKKGMLGLLGVGAWGTCAYFGATMVIASATNPLGWALLSIAAFMLLAALIVARIYCRIQTVHTEQNRQQIARTLSLRTDTGSSTRAMGFFPPPSSPRTSPSSSVAAASSDPNLPFPTLISSPAQ